MNVFILNAGRSGSTTFIRACEHITNYSSAHESRRSVLGPERLTYPRNHIEADNRLTWFLGRLDRSYGDRAMYVYLRRDAEAIASSHSKVDFGTMRAYRNDMVFGLPRSTDRLAVARDYVDTVDSNIEFFLRDKSNTMHIDLETAIEQFPEFWERIGAEGDLRAALMEFGVHHNSSEHVIERNARARGPIHSRAIRKLARVAVGFPGYLRNA